MRLARLFAASLAFVAASLVVLPALSAGLPPPQTVNLQVAVAADGSVQATQPMDAEVLPALAQAADQYARKLVFTPARKDGVPTPSQTHLSLVLAFEPVGDGKVGVKLRRASSGPGVAEVGKMELPKHSGQRGGATIVVSVEVDAQGRPDPETMKPESVALRDGSHFAEVRYLDAIRLSLRRTRLIPDRVAGKPVASRVSLPYRFGAGGAKPKPGDDGGRRGGKSAAPDPTATPALHATSTEAGISLPVIEYQAPAA